MDTTVHIVIRHLGTNHYLTAETRTAAELIQKSLAVTMPGACVELWRGDTRLV